MKNFILPALIVTTALLTACSASQQVAKHNAEKDKEIGTFIKNTRPADRAATLTKEMTQHLGLNASQQTAVANINLKYANRISLVMASTNPSISKKSEIQALLNQKAPQIKALLNQSQLQAYEANQAAYYDMYRTL